MNKIRIIARIDINNDSVVEGKCLGGGAEKNWKTK